MSFWSNLISFVISLTWLFASFFLEEHKDWEELELLRREKEERELQEQESMLKEREEKQKRAEVEVEGRKEAEKYKQAIIKFILIR